MTRLALNKSSMAKQNQKLKLYSNILPSLDMKRKQLLAAQGKARKALFKLEEEFKKIDILVEKELPMLSNKRIDLTDLVTVEDIIISSENVVGIKIPKLEEIKINLRTYAFLGKPQWVDFLSQLLKEAIEMKIKIKIAQKRLQLLDKATLTYTQRYNLFDKVLIPKTKANIKKIRIYLSDYERASLVNAKIAKKKREVAV